MLDEIEETALVPTERLPQYDASAGMAALAEMSQGEFEQRLAAMQRGRERLATIHRTLMKQDDDYGVIPGTAKPTLLKPGAEKLISFYRLAAEFKHDLSYCNDDTAPAITVITECRLHLGSLDGPVVNTGHGAANSWERRYRYRRGERVCPNCGMIGSIIKGKAEYGGGWLCFAKKGGCGAKFSEGVPAIVDQVVGDVENPDPFDLLNTLLKMSAKRSMTDAVLRATATSGLYTQDMEEVGQASAPTPPRQAQVIDQPPPPAEASEDEEDPFVNDEPRTPRAINQPGNGSALVCSQPSCAKPLTRGQYEVSFRAYGQALCPNCQRGAVRLG